MSGDKHTPGEWRPGRPDMFDLGPGSGAELAKSIYVDDPRGGFHHVTGARLPMEVARAHGETEEECWANAELIVRAVNSHGALVEALRAVCDSGVMLAESIEALVCAARAAAEGGEVKP